MIKVSRLQGKEWGKREGESWITLFHKLGISLNKASYWVLGILVGGGHVELWMGPYSVTLWRV